MSCHRRSSARISTGGSSAYSTTLAFPDRLTLEVTESGLVDDLDVASEMIESLHGMGVRIALDDFGTGYSSLAYLRALPLDCLKVDRRFVTDLAATGRDRIVVHGVIEMARALGISVVAEGSRPRRNALCWRVRAATGIRGISARRRCARKR
ncbi:EAL domain-containing protein [Hankyongella ginsenosidimutans]|uniref:EAL domain-containing protein n=1 Tax=Hankyongella ginsenosidimutans TaxID=1763828 RepID=A0A4D7CBK7_9SPHN|nr:EAL domain-containing protein [Hankyongella ginsenosidimutans]